MTLIVSGKPVLPVVLIGATIAFVISIKDYTDDYEVLHTLSKASYYRELYEVWLSE